MVNSSDSGHERQFFATSPGCVSGRLAYLCSAEIQFSTRMANRLQERLLHISAVKPIINHYLLVKEGVGLGRGVDSQRLKDALAFARDQDGPYFLQIHLMGTHCCGYKGARGWFDPDTMPAPRPEAREALAGYLGSIRDADAQIETFFEQLKASGELEKSILIITSDHSQRWDSVYRVPLIVHLPREQSQGRTKVCVSRCRPTQDCEEKEQEAA